MNQTDKNFMEKFESKIQDTIKKHNLLSKKDKVLVACSGGKDSTVILYLLEKLGYDVIALTIDVNIGEYSKKNLKNIRNYCKQWKIKLIERSFRKEFGHSLCHIKSLLYSKGIKLRSCAICGILKRYIINKTARKIKATKVATGHNLDDEAQNYLMNIFRNNLSINARLGPRSGLIRDIKFVPRVKPLYFTEEKDIKKYSKLLEFDIIYEHCPCSSDAYRNALRTLLDDYEKKIKSIKKNILKDFIKNLPKYKKKFATTKKLHHCKICGEPAKHKLCKSCTLIKMLK